jgi:arylsulfatase A-like enzyme
LPQLLKSPGYRTGFIGKWHLGNDGPYAPEKRGFDWCSTNAGAATVHFDPVITRNRKREQRTGYREDILFDEAMAFIDDAKDGPFFCYLATYSPHAPVKAPDSFKAPFVGKVDAEESEFLGMVANLDYNLGRITKHLSDRGLENNTLIIWMNDNGETHGLDVYNAGMRGCKATAWQGGSRAMSFWKWPGQWQPHAVQNLTAHLDVLPTLCDIAGARIPTDLEPKLEGWSLRPLLESTQPIAWHEDRMLFHHVGRWPGGLAAEHKYAMASVQFANYLLIRSEPCGSAACEKYASQCTTLRIVQKGGKRATYTRDNATFHWGVTAPRRWSLFDVSSDMECAHDLSLLKPEIAEKLASAYNVWWDDLYSTMIEKGGDKGMPEPFGGNAKE